MLVIGLIFTGLGIWNTFFPRSAWNYALGGSKRKDSERYRTYIRSKTYLIRVVVMGIMFLLIGLYGLYNSAWPALSKFLIQLR